MSEEDPEIIQLNKKQEAGAINVVKKVLDQPEVQNLLKYSINKQTLISGVFMSFLIIGLFTIVNDVKVALGLDWRADSVIGAIFVIVGGAYMAKQVMPRHKTP